MAHYIFGPINSRRFGTSLGIDLSPGEKRCNFDCLYCELAPKEAMAESDALFSVEAVIEELKAALEHHPKIDVITFTANGEPSMYKGFDQLIDAVKALQLDAKLLVLSNAALIDKEPVQKSFHKLDQVKLSLDAVTPEIFKKIDRPHDTISIDSIKKGIIDFAASYAGELIIEILFVSGINDTDTEVAALNDFLKALQPDRIDIGTIDRPPAYGVKPVSNERLDEISKRFAPELNISIAHRKEEKIKQSFYDKEEIMTTLDKRPLTVDDVHKLFDTPSLIALQELVEAEEVFLLQENNESFYILKKNLEKKRQKS